LHYSPFIRHYYQKNDDLQLLIQRLSAMNINIKAVLLSAFILPGIGQLYKGEKVKGAVFLVLVNVFLLASIFIVMKKMGSFLLTARISGSEEALKLLENITASSPEIGWLLSGFAILWGVAVVDAAMPLQKQDEIEPD
jgi:hypothetical protein